MKKYVLKNKDTGKFLSSMMTCDRKWSIVESETDNIKFSTTFDLEQILTICNTFSKYIPLRIFNVDGEKVIAENQKTIEEIESIIEKSKDILRQIE